eukprot:TRINITY_DN60993_c0_g1_i1.p1 TRINITY_DN60993_c0_g1~~TRINITY_DN60993_c0_g1_i1.p1  ORF type:complete len:511 (-),score=50.14 TRINITY_DN60993_c0_g1_i1:267-1772(-)
MAYRRNRRCSSKAFCFCALATVGVVRLLFGSTGEHSKIIDVLVGDRSGARNPGGSLTPADGEVNVSSTVQHKKANFSALLPSKASRRDERANRTGSGRKGRRRYAGKAKPPPAPQAARKEPDCFVPAGPPPRVVASIAVHPPKFHYVARFLEQRGKCLGALAALSVFVVFTNQGDLIKFRQMIGWYAPLVTKCEGFWWKALVANPPHEVMRIPGGVGNQQICAWKKWYGVLYSMDLPANEAPEYTLMLDSELNIYNMSDCGLDGRWSRLLSRLRDREASKKWFAARVSNDLLCYDFGDRGKQCGREYDKSLMRITSRHVTKHTLDSCKTDGCLKVKQQIDLALFSWWTDIPYVSLRIAAHMVAFLTGSQVSAALSATLRHTSSWSVLARKTTFTRFEHVEYQQWCVLHEGFQFRDVTHITGQASWGSYMEDPQPGARLAELHPLWVSSNAFSRAKRKIIPDLAPAEPYLVFHVDQAEGFNDCVPLHEHAWILKYKSRFNVP